METSMKELSFHMFIDSGQRMAGFVQFLVYKLISSRLKCTDKKSYCIFLLISQNIVILDFNVDAGSWLKFVRLWYD